MSQKDLSFDVISPVTNSTYISRSYATEDEIEIALKSSQKSFNEFWKNTSLEYRSQIALKSLDYFKENANEIEKELTYQMGRYRIFN